MKKKWIAVLVIAVLTGRLFAESTSVFNEEWLKAVISIEQLQNATNSRPIGTGFILGTPNSHLVLITAKHVVLNEDGSTKTNLAFIFNQKTNVMERIPDTLFNAIAGGWFMSTDADLACRFISYGNEADFRSIPVDQLLFKKQLQVGAPLLVLGFPLGLRSEKYAAPIARRGIVARNAEDELIVDSFVFPGNSGGPLVYVPTIKVGGNITSTLVNSEKIAGVVIDNISYVDVAISPQTKRPRVSFEENSGLCHAVPADKIMELLNRPDVRMHDAKLPH